MRAASAGKQATARNHGPGRRGAPAAAWAAAILAIAWLLLASVPKLPHLLATGVDDAWYYALNLIHRDGGRIGPDIAFTMGPLGYLTVPDPDLTPWWQPFLLRLCGWAGLVWGVWRLARVWPAWAAATAALALCSIHLLAGHYPDVWQASYLAVFAATAAAPSAAGLAAAGLMAGLTLLLKVNEALLACAIYALLVFHSRQAFPRRWPWLLAVPPAVLLAGCAAANGGIWTALPYLHWGVQVMLGYTEAASIAGPQWQTGLFLLTAAMLFAVPLLEDGLACLRSPLCWCAAVQAFMAFKHGMVRQDGHADLALVKLALAALFLMPLPRQEVSRRMLAVLMAFCGIFTWIYLAEARPRASQPAWNRLTPRGLAGGIATVAGYPAAYARMGEQSRRLREQLLLGEPFHSRIGAGSVDAFPDQVDWIRANGWKYRARPTIDAITAFTRRLSERNRAHLEGRAAPEWILYVHEAIDGRHPLMQDSGTVLAMLERYEPAHEDAKALLLERRRVPRRILFREIGSHTAGWDEPLALPPVSPPETLWAAFEIRPSLWGRLRWFWFRTSPVVLDVRFADGKVYWFRLLREFAQAPSPLDPLPRDLAQTAAYFRGESPADARPAQVVLRTSGPAEYGGRVRVRWYAARR